MDNLIKANAAVEQGEAGNIKPVLARSQVGTWPFKVVGKADPLEQPVVREHHLERSLTNTKPSLPTNERQRLEQM